MVKDFPNQKQSAALRDSSIYPFTDLKSVFHLYPMSPETSLFQPETT